jgi:hypothetical protein
VLTVAEPLGRATVLFKGIVLLALLAFAGRHIETAVPRVSGIDNVARYLVDNGRDDAVLFSGQHDGVFGFYVRAFDPSFSRRVMFSNKLLYRYEQDTAFIWRETPFVSSAADVAERVRRTCACRWVAVEREPDAWLNSSERLLRDAVKGPPFTLSASFRIAAHPVYAIDLYRLDGDIGAPPPIDLSFPSFSGRVFKNVLPIATRP